MNADTAIGIAKLTAREQYVIDVIAGIGDSQALRLALISRMAVIGVPVRDMTRLMSRYNDAVGGLALLIDQQCVTSNIVDPKANTRRLSAEKE